MSINVTVTGNPVSIRRGKTVLSDLDQLQKSERDRRRKLRLEQVRQQSKAISNRLLERARNITKSRLTQLEKDGRSELKQMHDRKLMDLRRKYQEDMEDIGQAHVSACLQPNVNVIIEADVGKNRMIAAERGKEAAQRLKEASQMKNTQSIQQERQRQVREIENARAAMVANLPTRLTSQNKSKADSDLTVGEEIIHKTPKKKRGKKINRPQKNIRKVIVESPDVQVVVSNQKPRSAINSASRATWRQGEVPEVLIESNKTVTDISEFPVVMTGLKSDEEVPRKSLPTLSSRSKADKVARYNPQDYKLDSSTFTSSSRSSSQSTVSDDSSYFSDGAVDQLKSQQTTRHTTSAASNKVQLYDHNTRQRNLYHRPLGVVQKIDTNGEPNAEEQARAMLQSDRVDDQLAYRRRRHAQRRGNDALLRDQVRRDYQKLQKNLDHLSREERKLTASQIHGPRINDIHLDPTQRQELLTKRQRDMSEAFETNFQNVHSETSTIDQRPFKRPVTISPYDEMDHIPRSSNAVWQETPFFESSEQMGEKENQNENKPSRNEQIFEMLRKVERQKRLLLREFGAELPDNIFSASMKPLFSEEASMPKSIPKNQPPPSQKTKEKIVNISENGDTRNMNTDRERKNSWPPSERIEIAVQTSILDEIGTAMDKSVQVEFTGTQESSDIQSSEEVIEKVNSGSELSSENIDRPNSDTGSSDSVEAGIVIDLSEKRVKVTPRKLKTNIKGSKRNSPRVVVKPRSMPTGMPNSLGKKLSRSMPVSKHSTPRSNVSSSRPVKITDKKVKIHLDDSRIKVQIHPSQNKNVSKNTSTETSVTESSEASRENKLYFKQKTKSKLIFSDTSTSYASPPPVVSDASRNGLMDTMPVLELLENSENESVKLRRKGLSPVSSPGTPSPRIINLPTNLVYSRYANNVLEFTDPWMSRSLQNAITILLPQQHSTPNNATDSIHSQQKTVVNRSDQTPDNCSCMNPQCKLMHSDMNNIQNFATNNYPEVLKRYQDLKIICTERIASLTDLIEKVRSDQRDMDLSINEQSNESTTLRIPLQTSARNNMQTVRKLVHSIQAIHNQLAQTLNESQQIIATEDREEKSKSLKNTSDTNNKSSLVNENSVPSDAADAPAPRVKNPHGSALGKSGPKIIRTEIVKIPLSHLRQIAKPQLIEEARTPEVAKSTSPMSSQRGEDLVKQLSKEILEQSKAIDNATMFENSQNSRDLAHQLSPLMQNIPMSSANKAISPSLSKTPDEQLDHVSLTFNHQTNVPTENVDSWSNAEDSSSKTETDFVPLLAGIPKIPRTQENGSDRSRPRPPVTLTHGPHRIPTESTGHELSTIVEFDTPDMVNKSQGSAKSPKGKSEKSLSEGYHNTGEKIVEPLGTMPRKQSPARVTKAASSSKTATPNQDKQEQMTQYTGTPKLSKDSDACADKCPRLANRSSVNSSDTSESNTDKAGSQRDDSNLSKDSLLNVSLELRKRNLIFHSQIDPETLSGPFHYSEYKKSVISPRTESDKEKITSTSSNSFSGLSGISEIATTPTSDVLKYTSSPEEMEVALRKMGLGWAATTLKKTREASALSSSSNSDAISITPARKIPSPLKKDLDMKTNYLPELSDVSSISMKYANKSTERALLLKARTSTPNIENSNSSSEKSTSTTINSSAGISHIPSDMIFIAPNLSLSSKKNVVTNDLTKLDHDFNNPTDAT